MKWSGVISGSVILPALLFSLSRSGFITDGNSKLVGSARIRQVRVKGDTCPLSPKLQSVIRECHAPYSLQTEDTLDYGEHWNTSVSANSSDLSSAWQYQSQSELRGQPVWGKLAVYRGGGYVIHLGTDPNNASRYHLLNYYWILCLGFISDSILKFASVDYAEYCRFDCAAFSVIYILVIFLHVR